MIRISGYATVWGEPSVDQYDNTVMSMTSSHKNKQTDEYVVDYRDNFAKFRGDAAKKALKLKNGDRIEITSGSVSCGYNKEAKKAWTATSIWDFDMAGGDKKKATPVDEGYDEDDDGLPV